MDKSIKDNLIKYIGSLLFELGKINFNINSNVGIIKRIEKDEKKIKVSINSYDNIINIDEFKLTTLYQIVNYLKKEVELNEIADVIIANSNKRLKKTTVIKRLRNKDINESKNFSIKDIKRVK
jgi:hypothetical protein